MKRKLFITTLIIVFSLAAGCEKEDERIDNFLVDFATVLHSQQIVFFQLDNQRILIPKELKNYSGNNGQRVILNYTPLRGDTIKVNDVADIFTGEIQTLKIFQQIYDDPVKIQSLWVGGDYLNMVFETEYHSRSHLIGLFRDMVSPTVDLYFSHFRNNDPPGYPQTFYVSFLISSLRPAGSSDPVSFRLFVNTYTRMREFDLELK